MNLTSVKLKTKWTDHWLLEWNGTSYRKEKWREPCRFPPLSIPGSDRNNVKLQKTHA